MADRSLAQWLNWLERVHPTEIELGLERIARVATALQLSFPHSRVVTVAGTNGKGSCVAAMQHLLLASGVAVGSYTSPHLQCYNERVCINGKPVSDAQLVAAFNAVEAARGDISLTYFEFGTLAALWLFQQQKLAVILLEVGLGGRLDAVNIIDPDVAIVTSVDLDHQQWLGNDRDSIGREKAGIFRSGRPALCGANMPQSVVERAGEELLQLGVDFSLQLQPQGYLWQAGQGLYRQLPALPLPPESVALALAALWQLDLLPTDSELVSLQHCHLPGRFQQLSYRQRRIYLDVAHNPAAVQRLASLLDLHTDNGNTAAVFAVMGDKDTKAMLDAMEGRISHWYLPPLAAIPRAMPATELASSLAARGWQYTLAASLQTAIDTAIEHSMPNDSIVIFGSFYTVAAALDYFSQQQVPQQVGEQ